MHPPMAATPWPHPFNLYGKNQFYPHLNYFAYYNQQFWKFDYIFTLLSTIVRLFYPHRLNYNISIHVNHKSIWSPNKDYSPYWVIHIFDSSKLYKYSFTIFSKNTYLSTSKPIQFLPFTICIDAPSCFIWIMK